MKKLNLNKDQIQKVILSLLGFAALIYVYFTFFLGPLSRSAESMKANIAELQTKVAASKSEIAKEMKLEREAGSATARFAELQAHTPEGAPIAWFPPRMRTFFSDHQIDKATARLESSEDYKQPELDQWSRYNWSVELPSAGFSELGKAIAELENTEPLFAIARIKIHTLPDDPRNQVVDLGITTTLAKR